jgi:hypothetical protein
MEFDFVSTYTRADAINDGVLIDITSTSKELGIKYPVAITQSLDVLIQDKPDCEDVAGRIKDIIHMLHCAIQGLIPSKKKGEDTIFYDLIMNNSKTDFSHYNPKIITLKALVHGGDNREPVMTIMLPEED